MSLLMLALKGIAGLAMCIAVGIGAAMLMSGVG